VKNIVGAAVTMLVIGVWVSAPWWAIIAGVLLCAGGTELAERTLR